MKAIITGASKGIGWAIAQNLASHGVDLILNARNEDDLNKKTKELKTQFPSIEIYSLAKDLSIKKEVLELSSFIQKKWKVVDILINNAGVFFPGQLIDEEEGKLESMINTNLYSAYYLTRALYSQIESSKQGHIFNMCSIASKIAYPNGGSYSISKFALLGFTKVLREELKTKNIKVTAILPGATWSNSWAGVDLPASRLMEANDIALSIWNAIQMSPSAVVEEIILRPQLGDL